jgi:predicted dehydrogenase
MAEKKIRIGFIGAGANTELRHIPGFLAMDGVELVSVSNRSRESSQRISTAYNIPNVYDNWADLIDAEDTNAICIGTWPYMHYSLVLSALEANKHVMTEARMCMNADEAHTMLEASRLRPYLTAQVVPAPHTLKIDQAIIEILSNGQIGDILSVDIATHQGTFIDHDGPLHWRNSRDISGYNIMQLGIWYECIMRWLGPAQTVQAITKVHVKSRKDSEGRSQHISVPDHVEILCEMYSGSILHMHCSSITGLSPSDAIWIYGTEGTIHVDIDSMKVFMGRRGESQISEIETPMEKQGTWRVEEEFINSIRGIETITHTDFATGVKYMEFTEAVTRSVQKGGKIHLPW